ncbi:MAG: GTP cyclohydrolase I, partial [Dehalococcoidia bacterium]
AIGYIPQGSLVDNSALSQVVDAYSRRLQTPERLGRQIGELLASQMAGVAVRVEYRELCENANAAEGPEDLSASDFATGVFRESPELWNRFLAAIS